ncbi:uncharacterized protein [Miscanthus floridulus]|uniref:uncharacterized protein n=1 Tax=Miscanthus floridulus TaxID=154761 RepID=UPI00345B3568
MQQPRRRPPRITKPADRVMRIQIFHIPLLSMNWTCFCPCCRIEGYKARWPNNEEQTCIYPDHLKKLLQYGPPPSYPQLNIHGLNAPIHPGASFRYGSGEWGKPLVAWTSLLWRCFQGSYNRMYLIMMGSLLTAASTRET